MGSRKINQLVKYTNNMEAMFYGLTERSIRRLAYKISVRNNIVHHFINDTK